MTFEECSTLRDEIAARVASIEAKWDQERTVDGPAICELRTHCRRIYPRFAGRYGNVGSQIVGMADAAKRAVDKGDIALLLTALARIDIALELHKSVNGAHAPERS